MVTITFKTRTGKEETIVARGGQSLMEAAVEAGIEAIEAICGGGLACATCHIWVEPEWLSVVGVASGDEAELLSEAEEVTPASRLSCQIKLSSALDGLIVTLPQPN